MISMELKIFILVSLAGVSFDFSRTLDEFFVFNFREHLGNGGVEGPKYQVGITMWSARVPTVSLP